MRTGRSLPHRSEVGMGKSPTPELDAARDDGDVLLSTLLIAHLGNESAAERLLTDLTRVYELSSDFEPDLPATARLRACRRAARTDALAIIEGGI